MNFHKIVCLIFFLISPFFFIFGFIFLILSLYLLIINRSLFINWNLYLINFSLDFPLYFDFMSCFFISIVLFIRSCILIYSEFYIKTDLYKIRFFYLIFLFILSIIFLILSPRLFSMLLGWDGLGLVSYCLVIYYQSFSSYCSGFITVLTNRIGDVFLLSSLSFCFSNGRWNYINFLRKENFFLFRLFFIASLTKRAQIPFSSWLPAAIAAPTPVSSLVHSSTLVTAGVYILIRFRYFLNEELKLILILVSLLTIVISGISAVFEYDLKKIIALSTLSQLGFIISSISLGLTNLAFFHLVCHAGFKALLFICAGIFIHRFFDNQDIRKFGALSQDFFLTLSIFNVANLSLCGFPFLSGFYSKDLILEIIIKERKIGFLYFFLFSFGTFLTVFYRFRLFFFLTFKSCLFCSSSRIFLYLPITELAIFPLFFISVILGFFGSNFFLFPINNIVIPSILKMLIIRICFFRFLLSWVLYHLRKFKYRFLLDFLFNIWFLYFLKTNFLSVNFWNSSSNLDLSSIGFVEKFLGQKSIFILNIVSNYLSLSIKLFFFWFFRFFFIFNCIIFFFIFK